MEHAQPSADSPGLCPERVEEITGTPAWGSQYRAVLLLLCGAAAAWYGAKSPQPDFVMAFGGFAALAWASARYLPPFSLARLSRLAEALTVKRLAGHGLTPLEPGAITSLARCTSIVVPLDGTLTEASSQVRSFAIDQDLFEAGPQLQNLAMETLLNGALRSHPSQPGFTPALTRLADSLGWNTVALLEEQRVLRKFPDSGRGYQSVLRLDTQRKRALYSCGQLSSLLPICSGLLRGDGHSVALTEHDKTHLLERAGQMAAQGLRVLAVARGNKLNRGSNDWESQLELLGLIGFEQPLRDGLAEELSAVRASKLELVVRSQDRAERVQSIVTAAGIQPSQLWLSLPLEQSRKRMQLMPDPALCLDSAQDTPLLEHCEAGLSVAWEDTENVASDMAVREPSLTNLLAAIAESRSLVARSRGLAGYLLSGSLAVLSIMVGGALLTLAGAGEVPLSLGHLLWLGPLLDSLFGHLLSRTKPSPLMPPLGRHYFRFSAALNGILAGVAVLLFSQTPILVFILARSIISLNYLHPSESLLSRVTLSNRSLLVLPALLLSLGVELFSAPSGESLMGLVALLLLPCEAVKWWGRRQGKR